MYLMLESKNKCCHYNVPELAIALRLQDTDKIFLCHTRERRMIGVN